MNKSGAGVEIDPEQAYRRAMGAFTTGVTVVTAADGAGAWSGMTVNSLTSVSLTPRLLLWCLGARSARYAPFAEADTWGVTVLGADAEATARRFAQAATQDLRGGEAEALAGVNVLRGGLAQLACRTHDRVQAGDHLIIIGEVLDVRVRDGAALTFFRGGYGEIAGSAD
ncbi:MAG: flavin reductase family protein [Alphaproteobacteria bacterium]|nr:flavin reductase family protein [Alphaproteobacteria bacterium]